MHSPIVIDDYSLVSHMNHEQEALIQDGDPHTLLHIATFASSPV